MLSIIAAIFLFGFVIFIHELGHFILAKINGVKVITFSIGFGPKLIKHKIGETEYALSAIPLGGYVQLLGMGEDVEDEALQKRSYRHQTIPKRASIIVAGSLFNFLSAIAIFFFVALAGMPELLPVVGEVMPNTPAAAAMLAVNDKIVEIDGEPIRQWDEMIAIIHQSADRQLALTVERDAELIAVSVTPESRIVKDMFGAEKEVGLIGIKPSGDTFILEKGFIDAIVSAVTRAIEISVLIITFIAKLIMAIIPLGDAIGGPIFIFQVAERQAEVGITAFFLFAALISINLAILNLLPIPVLDGGHLLFLGIEAIRGKPLSEKVLMVAHYIGFFLIIALIVFAVYSDIMRLVANGPMY